LGSSSKYSVGDAEAVGCLLAIWMLKGLNRLSRTPISIYTDSQSFIQSIGARRAKSGSYLTDEFLRLANLVTGDTAPSTMTHRIHLHWVAAHSKVSGNEQADREARLAARGSVSPLDQLPPILKKPLPLNVGKLKDKFDTRLKKSWADQWDDSPCKA
jgi:ribonuclease HI